MKALLTTTLYLSIFCLALKGQDTVFRYRLPHASTSGHEVSKAMIICSPGEDKHICLVMKIGDSLTYQLLDSGFRITNQFTELWRAQSDIFLNGEANGKCTLFDGSVFQYYFTIQPPHNPIFLCKTTIDFHGNNAEERPYMDYMSQYPTLGYVFNAVQEPYVVSLNAKRQQLYIDRLVSWSSYKHDSVDVSAIPEASTLFGFIHFVSEDQPQQLDNMAERTLAFSRGNQLLLLSNEPSAPLHLSIIDLTTFQAHFRDLSTLDGFDPVDSNAFFNVSSTILGDKLFVLRASATKSEIGIYTIPSLKQIKHLSFSTAQPPAFVRLPAKYRPGGAVQDPSATTKYTLDEYLKDISAGPTGIAVCKDVLGTYHLTIGTYYDHKRYLQRGAIPDYFDDGKLPDPGKTVREGDMPYTNYEQTPFSTHAVHRYYWNDIFATTTIFTDPNPTLHFRASFAKLDLDGATLGNIQGGDAPDADQKIRDWLRPETHNSGPVYSFEVGGKYYEGAYNKASRTYCIWQILPNSP